VAYACVQSVEQLVIMAPNVQMWLSSMVRRRARNSACTCSPQTVHVAHVLQLARGQLPHFRVRRRSGAKRGPRAPPRSVHEQPRERNRDVPRRVAARVLGSCVPARPFVHGQIEKRRPTSASSFFATSASLIAGAADWKRAKLGAQYACTPACRASSRGVQDHAADAVL
jgi:hypothetical protein